MLSLVLRQDLWENHAWNGPPPRSLGEPRLALATAKVSGGTTLSMVHNQDLWENNAEHDPPPGSLGGTTLSVVHREDLWGKRA